MEQFWPFKVNISNFHDKFVYLRPQTMWKSHLTCLYRPLDIILACLALKLVQFWPTLSNSDSLKSRFQISMINLCLLPQTMWKSHSICLSRPLDIILACLALISPILARIEQVWPSKVKISNFYDKSAFMASNHDKKSPYLPI